MVLNPLTLAEALRPWHGAGLFFLLAEEREFVAAQAGRTRKAPFPARCPDLLETECARTLPSPRATPPPVVVAPSVKAETLHHRGAAQETNEAEGQAMPPLPPDWQTLLHDARPAPILWTYAALGQDWRGKGNPERAKGLRELIGNLRLPRGSSAFWPLTLRDDWENGAPPQDRACFLQGLSRLRPHVVVIFGERSLALSPLSVSLPVPFSQQVQGGRLFILLPDWERLLEKPRLREQSSAYLHAAFDSLPALRRLR